MNPTNNLPQSLAKGLPARLVNAEPLISVYLRTLTSPQTIKTYNTELHMFISYLEEVGKGLEELSAEDISKYREHLIKTYSAATAAKKLAVLRRFLIFTYMARATPVKPELPPFFSQNPCAGPGTPPTTPTQAALSLF